MTTTEQWTSVAARHVRSIEEQTVQRVRRILGRNLKFYPALEGHLLMMQVVPKRMRSVFGFKFNKLEMWIGTKTCASMTDAKLEEMIVHDLQVFNEMYRINKASLP